MQRTEIRRRSRRCRVFGRQFEAVFTATLLGAAFLLPKAVSAQDAGSAQDEGSAQVEESAQDEGAGFSQRGHLRRSNRTGQWPFYTYEKFDDGRSKSTYLFSAIRIDEEPDGDYYHRFYPFYAKSSEDGGANRDLALFPAFFWHRRSPELDHDILFPIFGKWRAGEAKHTVIWPLMQVASDPMSAPYRTIPTLFRYGSWSDTGKSSWRLGVPFFLDLFAHRSEGESSATAFGSFFPFGSDTNGLSIGRRSRSSDGSWDAHLFPLFAAGNSADGDDGYVISPVFGKWSGRRSGFVIPPLLTWMSREEDDYSLWALAPFFSRWREERSGGMHVLPFYLSVDKHYDYVRRLERRATLVYGRDRKYNGDALVWDRKYVPLLLSSWARNPENEHQWSWNVLWPLFHGSGRSESDSSVRALPFYDARVSSTGDRFGIGGILYRRHRNFTSESTSHWVLFPFLHSKTSPNLTRRWAFPIYFSNTETWDERFDKKFGVALGGTNREKLSILLPFHVNSESVSAWEHEDILHTSTQRQRHFWPVYGRSESKVEETNDNGDVTVARHWRKHSSLWPFFSYEWDSLDGLEATAKRTIRAPWPILRHRWDADSSDFLLFPLLSIQNRSREDGLLESLSLVRSSRSNDYSRFRIHPFLFNYKWYERYGRESTTFTGPLWLFHYDNERQRDGTDDMWFHFLPLAFAQSKNGRGAGGVFPLFYRRDFGSDQIDYWSFSRFFFAWNRFVNDDERYTSILWKFLEYSSGDGGHHDFRMMHRLVVHRNVDGQREYAFNPLFSYFDDEQTGENRLRVLMFLYRSSSDGTRTKRSLLFIPLPGS
ncbi:MAG: hypothetical protein AAF517_08955 [Planctomycetota bacterium]